MDAHDNIDVLGLGEALNRFAARERFSKWRWSRWSSARRTI
jgi:hypothetical protein